MFTSVDSDRKTIQNLPSKDPSLLAKRKRQTGTNSCNWETPLDSFPIFPMLLASKRK